MTESLSATVQRLVDAPIARVWAAWTEAANVAEWMKCAEGVITDQMNWAPAEGAGLSFRMGVLGEWSAVTTGVFVVVEAPHRLVYRLEANTELDAPEMVVEVDLENRGQQTLVTVTQSGAPAEWIRATVESGWSVSVVLLERFVTQPKGISQ